MVVNSNWHQPPKLIKRDSAATTFIAWRSNHYQDAGVMRPSTSQRLNCLNCLSIQNQTTKIICHMCRVSSPSQWQHANRTRELKHYLLRRRAEAFRKIPGPWVSEDA